MTFFLIKPDSREAIEGGEELLERWESEPDSVIWAEITGPLDRAAEQLLIRRFNLHPLAIQDAKRDRHPPKLEIFDEATFLIFKTLTEDSTSIDFRTIQLAIFTGERFLVTRASGPSRAVDRLRGEVLKNAKRFSGGPGSLATRLIRLFVDRFLKILLELEPLLEKREAGLLEEKGDAVLVELTGHKTDLKRLRRIFLYHEQILNQQERAGSLTLLYYELASDLIEGFLSLSAHRLNGIMTILTIVTVVFVPLGFMAGIYGMNFDNMPELHTEFGYFILLSVMAATATTLLLVFWKRRWLS